VRESVGAAFTLRGLLELDPDDLAKGFMLLTHDQRSAIAAALAAAVFGVQAGPRAPSPLDALVSKLEGYLAALKRQVIRDAALAGEVAAQAEKAAAAVDAALAPLVEALQAL